MGKHVLLFLASLWFLTACSFFDESPAGDALPTQSLPTAPSLTAPATDLNASLSPVSPAGEPKRINPRAIDITPVAVPQWSRPDAIPPVYEPEFAPAEEVDIPDEDLVMGVAWDGEAKAYPIVVMQFREMVNDELAGIPILVSW